MVEKFEFGDFYRFCVSLGLAMILAALVLPLLLVKDEGLVRSAPAAQGAGHDPRLTVIEQDDLAKTQSDRKRYVRIAFTAAPAVMMVLSALGLGFFLYGVINWRSRQLERDLEESAKIAKVLKDLRPGTQDEVAFKRQAEDAEASSEPASDSMALLGKSVAGYAATENLVFSALQRGVHQAFEIYRDRKLGSQVVDGLLVPRKGDQPDVLVEVKLLKRGFKSGWLFEVIARTALMVDLYHQTFGRKARGLVIVVTNSAAIDRFTQSIISDEVDNRLPKMYPGVDVRIIDSNLMNDEAILGESFVEARPGLVITRSTS